MNEDYGLIPLESMAASKPCIGRNEGGLKETIRDGRDGFLVSSIWDMAEKMELISKDEERAVCMGRAGRAKVERDFTWDKFLLPIRGEGAGDGPGAGGEERRIVFRVDADPYRSPITAKEGLGPRFRAEGHRPFLRDNLPAHRSASVRGDGQGRRLRLPASGALQHAIMERRGHGEPLSQGWSRPARWWTTAG